MNLNIIGYLIYFILSSIIIYHVGNVCYTNGNVFIRNLLKKEVAFSIQINRMLLIGYYLLNIGYCAITIIHWDTIDSIPMLIAIITRKMSVIILIIAVMHYSNIYLIKKFIHKFL
ncbi:hypothetical protein [Zobellia uliginosa]|uniref:hypothetical protein n=1 Tax=Zobellia uliginosa TaxID=143224 RepID=UPI001C064A1D|nr:hypothetical protein [Zobellia uliginosa]MBU2947425.1 hypothetical protein [Zobellia uliginosa]